MPLAAPLALIESPLRFLEHHKYLSQVINLYIVHIHWYVVCTCASHMTFMPEHVFIWVLPSESAYRTQYSSPSIFHYNNYPSLLKYNIA